MSREFVANNINYPIYFNGDRSKGQFAITYRAPLQTMADHVQQLQNDGLL